MTLLRGKKECMDVARFMIRTSCMIIINEIFNVNINNQMFKIKMVKDSQGTLRIVMK